MITFSIQKQLQMGKNSLRSHDILDRVGAQVQSHLFPTVISLLRWKVVVLKIVICCSNKMLSVGVTMI